jgi:hypothetical protein
LFSEPPGGPKRFLFLCERGLERPKAILRGRDDGLGERDGQPGEAPRVRADDVETEVAVAMIEETIIEPAS